MTDIIYTCWITPTIFMCREDIPQQLATAAALAAGLRSADIGKTVSLVAPIKFHEAMGQHLHNWDFTMKLTHNNKGFGSWDINPMDMDMPKGQYIHLEEPVGG